MALLSNSTIKKYSEITKEKRVFVLENIKKYKPKKILEIGIAVGANSVII